MAVDGVPGACGRQGRKRALGESSGGSATESRNRGEKGVGGGWKFRFLFLLLVFCLISGKSIFLPFAQAMAGGSTTAGN